MSYKLGMPTLMEFNSIEENIALCKELRLDFIELNMNLPYCMPHNNNIEDLIKLKKEHYIDFTMHFPEEIDFAAFYPSIRETNISLFEELAIWGEKLEVGKINIHINPGVYFTLSEEKAWIYEKNKAKFLGNLVQSMKNLIKCAQKHNIKLCVENTTFPGFIEEVFQKIAELEGIYFTWDIGHDVKDGEKAGKFYSRNMDKISHMHLHDCDDFKDHKTLFDGNIDISNRLSFAEANELSVVLEVKTMESLKKSVKRLRAKNIMK